MTRQRRSDRSAAAAPAVDAARLTACLRSLPVLPVRREWRQRVLDAACAPDRARAADRRTPFVLRFPAPRWVRLAAAASVLVALGWGIRARVEGSASGLEIMRTFGMVTARRSDGGAVRAVFPGQELRPGDEILTPPFGQLDLYIPTVGQFRLKGDGRLGLMRVSSDGSLHLRLQRGTLLVRRFQEQIEPAIWIHTPRNRLRVVGNRLACSLDENGTAWFLGGSDSLVVEHIAIEATPEPASRDPLSEAERLRTLYVARNQRGVVNGRVARVLAQEVSPIERALLAEADRLHLPARTVPWACSQLQSDWGQVEVALRVEDGPLRAVRWLQAGGLVTNGRESRAVRALLEEAYGLARSASASGDQEEHRSSLARFERILAEHPSPAYNAQFHLLCAAYSHYLGERERAIEHLRQVERHTGDPDLVSLAWASWGAIEEAAGQQAEAAQRYRALVEQFPASVDADFARRRLGLAEGGAS